MSLLDDLLTGLQNGFGTEALIAAGSAFAQDERAEGIEAQALNTALKEFADHSGLQLVYLASIVDGLQSKGAAAGLSGLRFPEPARRLSAASRRRSFSWRRRARP